MPGPAMHHMIADRLRAAISARQGLGPTLTADAYDRIAQSLNDPRNLPYLFLGCQGPDFLFFNTKDLSPAVGSMVSTYYDVTDFIENFKREIEKLIPQPVLDALAALDEATNEVITSSSTLSEIQQLFGDMQAVTDAMSANLTEALKRFVAEFSVFELVGHPYRDGIPEGPKPPGFSVSAERATGKNEWWWFDALHYRKTGKFAQFLLEKTEPGSPLHLYAIGYLTHVTADTVGHPYVNSISGGPYRSQAQRHKASENFQDVFNMLNVRGDDWNRSRLHALYNFNFTGPIDTENNVPDAFTNIDPDLAKLLAEAINAIYQEDGDPSRPEYAKTVTPDEINDTYRIWYRWLRNSTDTGTLPVPVPYSLTAELREVWDKAMDNLGDVGDFVESSANQTGSLGIFGIFLLLAALVLAAIAAVAALIDAVLGALTTLGSATIRYVACLIYEQLYNAYQMLRLGVAMNGLAFPLPEHMTDPRIRHFANPSIMDINSVNAPMIAGRLPMLRFSSGSFLHQEFHLFYPPTAGEMPGVFAQPSSYMDKDSTWYAWGDIPLSPDVLEKLMALVPDADPNRNDNGTLLARILHDKSLLGNSLTLFQAMYDRSQNGKPLPDFNLDGDRGYGFLCWQQKGDPAPDFPNPINSSASMPGVELNFIR